MSEIKVNSIKGVGASTAAITVNNTDGTCTANITNNLSNRNLIINGAMQVAQRGTSSTTSGYGSVDRFRVAFSGTDEAPTQAQVDVASGTTPYTLGFRKALKVTNGNQTSGAGASDQIEINYRIEGQDMAGSGWNYISSSSKITLSFWVKSSVAQNFYGYIRSVSGTVRSHPYETGSLTADTWTKITKTFSGDSNITINNDNSVEFNFYLVPFFGTGSTASGVSLTAWNTYDATALMPDNTSTWYTTNDATLELTGVQLEVGSVATDFEHRSFAQELALCQRYCQVIKGGTAAASTQVALSENATLYSADTLYCSIPLKVSMRAAPSLSVTTGTNYYIVYTNGTGTDLTGSGMALNGNTSPDNMVIYQSGTSLGTSGRAAMIRLNNASSKVIFSSEL